MTWRDRLIERDRIYGQPYVVWRQGQPAYRPRRKDPNVIADLATVVLSFVVVSMLAFL